MAIPHAKPGEIVDLHGGHERAATKTTTLVKTPALELIRLVLPAGKEIAEHKVAGEITVQCLEGEIEFTGGGRTQRLSAGHLLYLGGNEPHAVRAVTDASVLVTILLR